MPAIEYRDLEHTAADVDAAIVAIGNHISNSSAHITSAERAEWNAKVDPSDLTAEETARQNADAALQTAINGKADTGDLTAETTAREQADASESATRAAADTKQTAALAELIDGGAKNRLSVNSGSTTSGQGYFVQNLPVSFPAGTYIWSMKRTGSASTSFVVKSADDTELARITRGAGVTDIVSEFTITDAAATVSIYVGYSTDVSEAMICSKAAYDISPSFVPYRPSWDEMYAMIKSLQSV